MKVALIHLSDIHLRTDKENPVFSGDASITAVAAAASARLSAHEIEACFIALTGDIAYHGLPDEYELAKSTLKALQEELVARIGTTVPLHMVVVPGNHDCDFKTRYPQNDARERLLATEGLETISTFSVEIVTALQAPYRAFATAAQPSDQRRVHAPGPCVEVHDFSLPGGLTRFYLLNTAWMSEVEEIQGRLVLPTAGLHLLDGPQPALSVVLQHHPRNWLRESNARDVARRLETLADVIITGHEHESDDAHVVRATGAQVSYVEGFALQTEAKPGIPRSAFKVLVIDTNAGSQITYDLILGADGSYAPLQDAPVARALRRNPKRLEDGFVWNAAGDDFVTDLGLPVQHDNRDRVRLDDLFVYPYVRKVSSPSDRGEETTGRLSAESIEWLGGSHLLLGGDLSGKTTLARKIFSDLRSRYDLVPVYVRGIEIKRAAAGDSRKLLDRAFALHYSTPLEKFLQLQRERRVLILDDVHRCPLRGGALARVISWFKQQFATIIALGDDLLLPDDALLVTDDAPFASFSRYQILPLGRTKQDELVTRWCTLGPERDPEDLRKRSAKILQQVNGLMGKRLVPNVPFFVLGILQQLEMLRDSETFTGSQGAVFEAMATLKLQIHFREELLMAKSYLAHFAFRLFQSRKRFMTSSEFESWHDAFCAKLKIRLNAADIERKLTDSQLILSVDGEVGFRHRFGYYLFVAEYLSRHMEDEETKALVRKMCSSLFHEELSNILIFLCFKAIGHTDFIVRTMLGASKDIYSSQVPAKFEGDALAFEKLISAAEAPVLRSANPVERRSLLLESADSVEDHDDYGSLKDDDLGRDDNAESQYPGELKEVYAAVRTIQILGQILRNFYGSLEGHQKVEIASAAYDLGMRVANWYFGYATEHHEDMAKEIARVVLEEHPNLKSDPARFVRKVREVLAGFAEMVGLGMVKRVADATAMRALEPVLGEVLRESGQPRSAAYQLIWLALRLTLDGDTPVAEIRAAARELGNNVYAFRLFQNLCYQHLHIYYVDAATTQQVCDAAGIKPSVQVFDTEIKRLPGRGGS